MSAEKKESGQYQLVLTCLADHPKAVTVLRTARKRAAETGGKWRAVFIETPEYAMNAQEGAQQRMLRLLALVTQMGGETAHIHADTLEKGIVRLMEEERERLALLIIGDGQIELQGAKRPSSPWDRAISAARKRHLAVEIVTLSQANYRHSLRDRFRWIKLHYAFYALLAVGLALLCASLLEVALPPALFRINNQNIGLIFMIACAFAAGRFGLLPGLVASVASYLILNYCFTLPYHAIKFNNLTDTLNMMLFLSAALLISFFTSRTRNYAQKAAKRELNTQALFTLYRLAANASTRKQALEELQVKLTRMLMMDVAFFLPPVLNPGAIEPGCPETISLNDSDLQALNLCWKEMKTAGLASPVYPQSAWRFEPMVSPGGEIGVLGVRPHRKGQIDAWFGQLLTAIADQTAAAIEHIELERSMEATRIREEREKLRSMLLSSVSHDLKTPLASIIGALNIYRSQGKKLSLENQEALIETALEESERLDSFINNILAMTHLESGRMDFKPDWGDMHGAVRHVVRKLEHRLRTHPVKIHPFPKDTEVFMDALLIEQVLQNVLDNAGKYTPNGTRIEITGTAKEHGGFTCEVRDHGAGLPGEKLERVFDKYARLQKQDSQVAGTGLGLAICKAMMEGQGGSITASNHPEGGALFTLYLPRWRKADTTKYVA